MVMGEVLPLPGLGDVFTDVRGEDRTLRVSCHPERGLVVLSLWAGATCRGSFRLGAGDLPRLLAVLGQVPAAAPVPEPAADTPDTVHFLRPGLVLVPRVA